jgi:hypothetical protein
MIEMSDFSWPERRQQHPGPKPPSHDTVEYFQENCLVIAGTIINIGLKNYFEMLARNSVADITDDGKSATPLAVYRLERMKSVIESIKAYSLEELQLLVFTQLACPEDTTHVSSSQ